MSVPSLIPIAHEPDYRTDRIGRYDDGLFMVLAWDHHAYAHLFDHDGAHLRSTIVRVEDRSSLDAVLEELAGALPGRAYSDIAVGLFRVEQDGVVFGLIDETGEHGDDGWVELYPDRLGFTEPWDGTYDT